MSQLPKVDFKAIAEDITHFYRKDIKDDDTRTMLQMEIENALASAYEWGAWNYRSKQLLDGFTKFQQSLKSN